MSTPFLVTDVVHIHYLWAIFADITIKFVTVHIDYSSLVLVE